MVCGHLDDGDGFWVGEMEETKMERFGGEGSNGE